MEVVNLAAKLVLLSHLSSSPNNRHSLWLLFDYITTLARYDLDYPIRDRARFLKGLLSRAGVRTNGQNGSDANELDSFSKGEEVASSISEQSEQLLTVAQVQKMLFGSSSAPSADLIPGMFKAAVQYTLTLHRL
jgi:AP-3 complex subunit beta